MSHRSCAFTLVLASSLFFVAADESDGATWIVDPEGSGHAFTVTAGLGLASPGDTVLVRPGTFFENLFMKPQVTLRSASGPLVTVLDGSSEDATITCQSMGPETLIEGFTITHGFSDFIGGGLRCEHEGSPTIRGNRFTANYAFAGSAIGCTDGSSPVIEHNALYDNEAEIGGGGIQVWDHCGNVIIRNNEIHHNRGGVAFGESCSGSVTGNLIADNHQGGGGGGMWLGWGSAETITISYNIFLRNEGSVGGAIYAGAIGSVIIDHNTFVGNSSREGGDAIYIQADVVVAINHNIFANSHGYGPTIRARAFAGCNDFWSNEGPAYSEAPGEHDVELDPEFCDPAADHYGLMSTSPCLDAPDCGLIGALGLGCSATAAVPVSWGHTKTLFR